MSFEAVKWAMDEGERRNLEPAQRFLLLLLGNVADEDGGRVFPSHAYLARRTGFSRATVKRHIKALEENGLLTKEHRVREHDGSQTSNIYQLAMKQADLPLPPPVHHDPGVTVSPGAQLCTPPGVTAVTPHEGKEVVGMKEKPPRGSKAPSAVAECWKAYAEAVKARHGIEPPTNAKSNGQLANIVGRVGAEGALQLVRFYVAHSDPFYVKTYHSLDYLVRDCDKRLWIEMGRQTGGRQAPVPTKAEVKFEYEGGQTRVLQDYPLGNPLEIAQQCKRDYARMVANTHPKNIVVQTGAQAHRYSIAELDTGRRA